MTDKPKTAGLTRRSFARGIALVPGISSAFAGGSQRLESEFRNPPASSRPWVYWWWLDGAASKEGITADLEEMKSKGIRGVLLFDCGYGGPEAPKGPIFMSGPWRENFRHAVREAARLGLEMGVNLCSGWDAGGPWVTPELAMKALVWAESRVAGPAHMDDSLPQPGTKGDWYRDIGVLACREGDGAAWMSHEIVDLTPAMRDGRLRWDVPEGRWTVLRLGYTLAGKLTSLPSSPQAQGYEIDQLSAEAMDLHYAETAAKLVADAGALAGRTFKYTHIDSWESGKLTWTDKLIGEFRNRRGYDPLKYLPALAGKTVDDPQITERFKWDYRRTLADLVAQNYYGRLHELSRQHQLGTHSESGGPFFAHPIDALECEGINDIPMGEFWLDKTQYNSMRQAVSAAHVYGKPLSQAEAFTSNSDDYSDDPYALKKQGDRALCNGLTRMVLHHYVHQPRLDIKPGYHWVHIGTSFDRNVTWWNKSHAWLGYLTRCQHLLRQGMFVADILYFSGEPIPNFVLFDHKTPAGYDSDVINSQALLTRAGVKAGRLVLPDGMSYRYLVILDKAIGRTSPRSPDRMSPAVLGKIRDLVEGGVTLVGPRPRCAPGLTGYPACDESVKALADSLWGMDGAASGERAFCKGRVIWAKPLEEVLRADGVAPDVEFRIGSGNPDFDWIHRVADGVDIYFVSNQTDEKSDVEAVFRVQGKRPELWDPASGTIRRLPEFRTERGRTVAPLRFEARQSFFILFRQEGNGSGRGAGAGRNFADLREIAEIRGPWKVSFDPRWGGPEEAVFQTLEDWTARPEEGIRYYSGTAVYRNTFDLPARSSRAIYLDLGTVKNLAEVRLNGKNLGVVWSSPWRVEITGAVREKRNELVIEVVNLWPNRLIGDGKLPKEQRRTVTNVRTYDPVIPDWLNTRGCPKCERRKTGKPADLLPSGLLGPVTVRAV